MQAVTKLLAWQKATELVDEISIITGTFPDHERFGLTNQLRRAAASIVANLAEGAGRYTYPDKANKYTIARGECFEVFALLHVSARQQFVAPEKAAQTFLLIEHVSKLLSGLIRSCRTEKV